MQLRAIRLALQLLLSTSLLAAQETIGGDAESLARPYLNLMKQRQAQRIEEVRYKRKAGMEAEEEVWEEKGKEWGSLMREELGMVVRQFPNWRPWGTRVRHSSQGIEANPARGTVHQEL